MDFIFSGWSYRPTTQNIQLQVFFTLSFFMILFVLLLLLFSLSYHGDTMYMCVPIYFPVFLSVRRPQISCGTYLFLHSFGSSFLLYYCDSQTQTPASIWIARSYYLDSSEGEEIRSSFIETGQFFLLRWVVSIWKSKRTVAVDESVRRSNDLTTSFVTFGCLDPLIPFLRRRYSDMARFSHPSKLFHLLRVWDTIVEDQSLCWYPMHVRI